MPLDEDSDGSDSVLEFDGGDEHTLATHAVDPIADARSRASEAPKKRVRRPRKPPGAPPQARAASTAARAPVRRPTARSKGEARRASSKSDMAQDDPILHGGASGDSDDLFEYDVDDTMQAEQMARSTTAAVSTGCARRGVVDDDDEVMFGGSDEDSQPHHPLSAQDRSALATGKGAASDASHVRATEAVGAPVEYKCEALARLRAHIDTLRAGGLEAGCIAELLDAMTLDVDTAEGGWTELRNAHESNLCVVRNAVQRELTQIECRIAVITDRVQQVHGSTAMAGAVAGLKAMELASTALCPRETNAVQRVGRLDNATARVDMLDTARVRV